MKRITKRYILISLFVLTLVREAVAQVGTDSSTLQTLTSMNIRHGVLPNGLTYYIHRSEEEDKVFLNLIVKAGFNHQDIDQVEMPHLLEHMAFVKTKHFENPWEYFLKQGLSSGKAINAYTQTDNTRYFLILSDHNKELIKSGLLFLSDCAQGILLEKARTDSERDVVIEELRLGDTYDNRLRYQIRRAQMNETYESTSRIASLKRFKFSRLLDFYEEWYRPDLQAVIIDGNINPDSAEYYIRKFFSELKASHIKIRREIQTTQYRTTPTFNVFLNNESKIVEFNFTSVYHDDGTHSIDVIRSNVLQEIVKEIFSKRLDKLRISGNGGLLGHRLYLYSGEHTNNRVGTFTVKTSIDSMKRQFQEVVIELERLIRYGATDNELGVAKQSFLDRYKRQHMGRIVEEDMISNFLYNTPLHGIAIQKEVQNMVNEISWPDLNQILKGWIDPDNQHVTLIAPESALSNLPDTQSLKNWIKQAIIKPIIPYVPIVLDTIVKPLLTQQQLKGIHSKIKFRESELKEVGATKLVLPNGIHVILKNLPNKESHGRIYVRMLSLHDTQNLNINDNLSLQYAMNTVNQSGLGDLNAEELERFKENKRLAIWASLNGNHPVISGQCSRESLEAMLQLVTQYFTSPRADQAIFNQLHESVKSNEFIKLMDPETEFENLTSASASSSAIFRPEDYKNNTFERGMDLYKQYFTNPSQFIFVLAGDFNPDEIKALIAQYLNSLEVVQKLKSKTSPIKSKPVTIDIGPEGKVIYGAKDGKASVFLHLQGLCVNDAKNNLMVDALGKALQSVLYTRLREVEGDVYGVYSGSGLPEYQNRYNFFIQYSCDPIKMEKTIANVEEEIGKLQTQGATLEVCEKIRTQQKEELTRRLSGPYFWSRYISDQIVNKKDLEEVEEYDNWIEEINPELIKQLALKYLNKEQMKKFVLMPGEE